MSQGLKQRIVGAFVLGAVGLVLLPMVFDFVAPQRVDRNSQLPPAPEIQAVEVARAKRPTAVADKHLTAPIFDVEKSISAVGDTEHPYGLNADGLPKGWVLQVSSFETRVTAEQLMQQLRKEKFKAFIKRVSLDNKAYYRVYVGPKIDRRRVVADKKNIDKLFKTHAMVLPYIP